MQLRYHNIIPDQIYFERDTMHMVLFLKKLFLILTFAQVLKTFAIKPTCK